MITFMLTIYSAIAFLLFKFKIIRPRPYPVVCVIVGGGLLVGGIAAAWMLFSPVTSKLVAMQYVVQLVPYVKGQVLKIHAQPNQPMKKGDLLLEINPEPYQATVNQLRAQLNVARATVEQAEAALAAAKANVEKTKDGISQAQAAFEQAKAAVVTAQSGLEKSKAADELAKTEEQIALNLQKTDSGAISTLKVAQATQKRAETDAAVKQAVAAVTESKAAQQQADSGVAAARSTQLQAAAAERQAVFTVKVAESNVPAVQAQLGDAEFNLTQCKMLAPADGYVIDWVVQEGSMLIPLVFASAGTFVKTSETNIIAVFPQNYLTNVVPGNDVELVLDPYPGRLFKGKVDYVIPATGEGEFLPNKQVPYAAKIGSYGVLAVRIHLADDYRSTPIPLGAGGMVTIYTDHGKPVHVISKVTIRMQKWLLYVLPSVNKQ